MARSCCDVIGELTLIQRQSENGMVMTMSRIDKAVKAHAVNPGPSGSSEIINNDVIFGQPFSHHQNREEFMKTTHRLILSLICIVIRYFRFKNRCLTVLLFLYYYIFVM